MKKNTILLPLMLLFPCVIFAQSKRDNEILVNPAYEIADWQGFRTSAVTYTFDDNTKKQFTVAKPLFDRYNYKATFFVITSKITDWANYINAANNGHEIASHTISHNRLDKLTLEEQERELGNSQELIKSKVKSNCSTLAYPNCALSDKEITRKYYIAGRVCTGSVVPRTPVDFYRISSISTGSASSNYVQTPEQFNAKVDLAKVSKGWCVFLIHCIDDEKSYSPTQSASIAKHLEYVNENENHFWVTTFEQAVKYIRERDAVSVSEIALNADSYEIMVSDNLEDDIYNVPISVRRILPDGWESASLVQNGKHLESKLETISGKRYLVFDVIPDSGELILSKTNATHVPVITEKPVLISPNPFRNTIDIVANDNFKYEIYNMEGYLLESGAGCGRVQTGESLPVGSFLVKVYCRNQTFEHKIIKK